MAGFSDVNPALNSHKKRKSISKTIRFEVFKRDSFTCQYCGRPAPEIILEIDHVAPVAGGGDNSILNLVTSCSDCNSGKGAKPLSDKSAIAKQKEMLDELNERRLQLEMLLEWRQGLSGLEEKQTNHISELFKGMTGFSLTDHGKRDIKRMIKKYGLDEVIQSTEIAIDSYFLERTSEYSAKTFSYIARICASRKRKAERPEDDEALHWAYKIRKRMQAKGFYIRKDLVEFILSAIKSGVQPEDIYDYANFAHNSYDLQGTVESWIGDAS